MTNLFDLTGRIAVVTGSAQGMGRAMATALAETGADLVLLDRNEAGIEATAHSIRQLGRKALPIAGDVTDTDHIDRVFATVDGEVRAAGVGEPESRCCLHRSSARPVRVRAMSDASAVRPNILASG